LHAINFLFPLTASFAAEWLVSPLEQPTWLAAKEDSEGEWQVLGCVETFVGKPGYSGEVILYLSCRYFHTRGIV
jgi:hypothetical protein